ncbi:Arrestin domain-containing protein 3 [Trichoplax sp. H2]|nr:Arrestin domain-containing protein 3 [Trichoplax sp. H2]|eukprot:RDD42412.1 Arrestin domain-containing protein 3 [Trichoplax sp. H2]
MPKKIKNLEVLVTDEKEYYYPNDQISGNVSFRATSNVLVQNITLKVSGIAATKIKAKDVSGRQSTFRDCYVIFEQKIVLVGVEQGGTSGIPQGEHRFPFSFVLPRNLPSTYQDAEQPKHIHVAYGIETIFNYPKGNSDKKLKPFTIRNVININDPCYSHLPNPVEQETRVRRCCCGSGSIKLLAVIEKVAYLPLQPCLILGEVQNYSKRKVPDVTVHLMRIENYKAQDRSALKSTEIARMSYGEVKPGDTINLENKPFIVPANIASTILNCNLMEITFALNFLVIVPRGENLTASFQVVIGTMEEEPNSTTTADISLHPTDNVNEGRNCSGSFSSPPPYSSIIESEQLIQDSNIAPEA